MKRFLFLICALAFASFAGVGAQEWSLTLGAGDGLPGENVQKGTATVQVYKSEVITPSEPLTTLRFTVAENYNGEKPNNGNFVTALSELVVYAADGTTVIPYTATSNADHNASGSTDGAGLSALNDGNWNNYWHSSWSWNLIVSEYHHLELTFESPISEFILEWGARPGNPKNAPTLVGLTKGGVDYVPYSDWAFTVADEITSMEQLNGAQYFVMKGNNPVEYHTYVNNHDSDQPFGTQTNEEPYIGPGPQFVAPGMAADEAAPSYAIQLIPADGGYYLYYVTEGAYMAGNWNGLNGEIVKTTKLDEAAIVTIEEDGNSRFEMYFTLEHEGEELEIHVGARANNGRFKTVDAPRYNFFKEGHEYCENFGYLISFDWSLYEVTMNYPVKYISIPVRNAVKEAKGIYTFMDSVAVEGYENDYDNFMAVLAEAEGRIADGYYTDVTLVSEDVTALQEAMGAYVYSKIQWYQDVYFPEFEAEYSGLLTPSNYPIEGMYLEESYYEYIQQNLIDRCYELYGEAGENSYAHIAAMKTFINSVESNIKSFLASRITYVELPKVYTSEDPHVTPLGAKNGNHWDWEQLIALKESVSGIRLTFLETNSGSSYSDGKYRGYPMVALSGLEILDKNGDIVEISEELVSTNSLELSEGSIANLFDNDEGTFYHSIWGNGTMSPEGYVYLDIQFPEGAELSTFTIKTIGRNNATLSPGTVCITNYGVEYDPLILRENAYNVTGGTQITDVAQLKDGGIYIISGNLRVKTEGDAPRFYSGTKPYHTDIRAALNDTCVYMFKKRGDGWNIISLANANYWSVYKVYDKYTNLEGETVTNPYWGASSTVYPSEAANIKIAKSNNIRDAFTLYSDIGDNYVEASWSLDYSDEPLEIVPGVVNANKFVFMDWDAGLAGRPCVSELPGVFEYGFSEIANHSMAADIINGDGYSAGDYLHFNKANGVGEWNIYEVSMDDVYYLWANGIPAILESLGFVTGNDPGCLAGDISALESAVDAVTAVVANEDKEGAQAAVEAFVANVDLAKTAGRVGVVDGCRYAIESAYPEFYNRQGRVKAIYASESGLGWKDAPAEYNNDNEEFIFEFHKYDGVNDPEGYDVPQGVADDVYKIYNRKFESYVGLESGNSTPITMTDDFGAGVYVVKPLIGNIHTIYAIGQNPLHTAGHDNGNGTSGNIVYWSGGAGTPSSWVIRLVDDEEEISIAKEELIKSKDSLKALLDGLEGNQVIAEAKDLVYSVEANIDRYNASEIEEMISKLENAYQKVYNSVQLNVTGDNRFDITAASYTLPFELNNSVSNFTGFQCNVYLPEGFSIAKNEDGDYDVELNRERVASNHTISTVKQNDGSYFIVCYSSTNSNIKGENGVLFNINIVADENIGVGDYSVECKNILFSTSDGVEFNTQESSYVFRMSRFFDTNNDGFVTEDDIETLAYHLIGKQTANFDSNVYDVDRNGTIDLKDLQVLADVVQGRTSVAGDELYATGIYTEDVNSFIGEEYSIPLNLEYTGEATALRGTITVPYTMSIAKDENGVYDIRMTERATESHRLLVWETRNTDRCNFILYSTNNEPLNGNSGNLYNVYLETGDIAGNANGRVQMTLIDMCSPNGVYTAIHNNDYTVSEVNLYVPADANKDDVADVADLNEVATALAGDSDMWNHLEKFAADLNRDNDITILDVVAISDAVKNGYVKREMSVLPDNGGLKLEFAEASHSLESKIYIPLCINSEYDVTALQFDLSISGKAYIGTIELAGAAAGTHICETRDFDGFTRVVVYSENNDVINDEFITLTINRNGALGQSTVAVSNIKAATTGFEEYTSDATVETVANFGKPGDVNGDGKISIADIVLTVNALMGNVQQNFIFVAADMNGDGKISIGDVVLVVNRLLEGDEPVTPPSGSVNIGDDVEDAVTNAPMKRGLSNIYVSNAVVEDGEATMVVRLDDAEKYTAMQFDIALPAGVSIKEITMNGKHSVAYNESRVVVYSLTNNVFGKDDEIMSITLNVDNAVEGETIALDNIVVSTPAFVERRLNAVNARLEGTTGVDAAGYETTRVYAENGRIVIEAVCDGVVEIISSNGIVYKTEITAGKNCIAVEHQGIYVVKVGDRVTKLLF